MDREVLVTVSGLLSLGDVEAERQDIEVIAPGQYYWKNGKHYVTYDEMAENFSEPVHNLLKISPETVSIRKKGLIETELTFTKGKENVSHYSTPFGNLVLGIRARELEVKEENDGIQVNVEYALEINYEHISDCFIKIRVQDKEAKDFSLLS
ncbi:DUF1934 domain-containing protein [Hominifimenecus sp. rT4P-3]|uniref:DUF1934 domain-containing protein n=1 Tax=Hominifimenecus sp. rT4P-3 TaxID=3242979 RepID=UPI003DA612CA